MDGMNEIEFIAEVGQNHQGDVECAIRYVETFAQLGASTVKFQVRDNRYLFDDSRFNLPYDSTNAFGSTYGEHREALELTIDELSRVSKACKQNNVRFCCTPFDPKSLERLMKLEIDSLKVSSFDLGNINFLKQIGATKKPTIISTGGGSHKHIVASVEALDCGQEISILHCTSEYPCPADRVGLEAIQVLKQDFPGRRVGLSDHFNGTLTGPLGRLMGAEVFEKHVTFDRSQKGSDHKFSLEPTGFKKFVRDTVRAGKMLQRTDKEGIGEEPVFERLGKSCVARRDIKRGDVLRIDDIDGRIFASQIIPIRNCMDLVGRIAVIDFSEGQPFTLEGISDGG